MTRREKSLSRDAIIQASIQLLDRGGEAALTFRALAERLATGPGALYWHVSNKTDLLTAACDGVIAHALSASAGAPEPADAIRAIALGVFEALDAHPWVGSVLSRSPSELPIVRLLESLGQPVRALGVAPARQRATASALFSYILGVATQNAANSHYARVHDLNRTRYLEGVAARWAQLPADAYPFTRSIAPQLPPHDDREDFLAGIDLLLAGISAVCAP